MHAWAAPSRLSRVNSENIRQPGGEDQVLLPRPARNLTPSHSEYIQFKAPNNSNKWGKRRRLIPDWRHHQYHSNDCRTAVSFVDGSLILNVPLPDFCTSATQSVPCGSCRELSCSNDCVEGIIDALMSTAPKAFAASWLWKTAALKAGLTIKSSAE